MYGNDEIQPKLIYLTRRNPAFGRAEWTPRWREHGALGMSLPRWSNVARYVHCDLVEPDPQHRAYLSDHDGIGLIWHRSIPHRDAHFADTSSQETMVRDEMLTFSRPIALDCLSAMERIVVPPPQDGRCPFKLTAFLQDRAESETPPSAGGHVRNLPLPPPAGGGWGLSCASVEEFWFAEMADALKSARDVHEATGATCVIGTEVELFRR